jgi:hypothetical protein
MGTELGCGSLAPNDCNAAKTSTRPYLMVKLVCTEVDSIACSTWVFVKDGFWLNNKPATPAATGEAKDVPPTGA